MGAERRLGSLAAHIRTIVSSFKPDQTPTEPQITSDSVRLKLSGIEDLRRQSTVDIHAQVADPNQTNRIKNILSKLGIQFTPNSCLRVKPNISSIKGITSFGLEEAYIQDGTLYKEPAGAFSQVTAALEPHLVDGGPRALIKSLHIQQPSGDDLPAIPGNKLSSTDGLLLLDALASAVLQKQVKH